ncbi:MAG: ribosome biogenesis GTPase Der [Bacteriovoracaceae bacterium]
MSQTKKNHFVISLIGRPNTGKSTIFNRLMERQHKAITFDKPGVTRDRHYGLVTWEGLREDEEFEVVLVDTGGFYPDLQNSQVEEVKKVDVFFDKMKDHAREAIKESDLVLLVVDGREGPLPADQSIIDELMTSGKPFLLLVNKLDSSKQDGDELSFYELGVDEFQMFSLSASHGRGFGSLKNSMLDILSEITEIRNQEQESLEGSLGLQKGLRPEHDVVARVSIIGAPNAGKSTLLNHLLGANRALVTPISGTTADPIDGYFSLDFGKKAHSLENKRRHLVKDKQLIQEYEKLKAFQEDPENFEGELPNFETEEVQEPTNGETRRSVHLIDTAGIRKQSHVKEFVESQSVYRALRCISESDVILFLVDSEKGITHQDRRLLDVAFEKGKSVIICMNKFDLVETTFSERGDRQVWLKNLRVKIPWLDFCQIVTMSAKTGKGIDSLRGTLKETILIRQKKVPTAELNQLVQHLVDQHPLMIQKSRGKYFRVKYASLVKNDPPTFLLFANGSKGITSNYKKYLQNNLRNYFGYQNTPVHVIFRSNSDLNRKMK